MSFALLLFQFPAQICYYPRKDEDNPLFAFRHILTQAFLAACILSIPQPVFAEGLFERLFGNQNRARVEKKAEKPKPKRRAPPRPKGPIVPSMILAGGTAIEILVVGDSLATNLWQGMRARFENHANVTITRLTRNNSGLVRDDFYDWNKTLRTRLHAKRADIVVFMLGLNDAQRFAPAKTPPKNGKRLKPAIFSSPRWQEAYSARIDSLLKLLRSNRSRVYWVGLPIMRKRTLSEDLSYINEVLRERTELAGAKFIDIWDAFTGEDGGYSRSGPDLSGRIRNLRARDGIHFTAAGAKKLAHFPAQAIFADFGSSPLARSTARAGSGAIRRPQIVISPGSQPPYGAAQPAARPTGSIYAPAPNPFLPPPPMPAADKFLERGEALQPVPGRADDFSWPRK